MDATSELKRDRLSILMLPWLAHGHISPFLELAKTLSNRNFLIYFCSTSVNLDAIKANLPSSSSSSSSSFSIRFVQLHLPSSVDFPSHLHTTKGLPSHLMSTLKQAFSMAAPDFHSVLQTLCPDLVIYDSLQPWAPAVASSLRIPAVNFNTTGASIITRVLHFIHNPDSKYPEPDQIRWKTMYTKPDGGLTDEASKDVEGFLKCLYSSKDVILINSFREIEGKYIDDLSVLSNKRIIPVGPLIHEPDPDEEDDEDEEDDDDSKITDWLDKKEPFSTVFVSFGSEYFLSKEEIEEIANGLEQSGVNFIWVIRFPKGETRKSAIDETLPNGFIEKVGEKGMVVKDWAPQSKILKNGKIGGFLSHCGWNSVMESMIFGVPIIALPMHLDQPLNARIVVEVGVGLEAKRDLQGKIQSGEICKLIKEMVVEKTREDVRKKAKEISEIMKSKGEEKIDDLVSAISNLCRG